MGDQNIRKWVKRKLDEGQSREPLKKALENQGLDPSIVDKVAQNRQTRDTSEQKSFEIPDINVFKYGKPVIVIVLIAGLVFGATTLIDSNSISFSPSENSTQTVDQSDNEEGPFQVVLEDGVANPARPEIDPSRDVRFVNRENHSLRMVFERNIETFTLTSGDSKKVDIDDLVYYSAEPIDADTGSIQGSINIQ